MAEKVQCPNCLMVAEKDGNVIVCEHCDATYKVTKAGPAKAQKIGWKQDVEGRLDRAEQQIAELFGGDEPEPDDQDEPEPEPDEAEEDILPR